MCRFDLYIYEYILCACVRKPNREQTRHTYVPYVLTAEFTRHDVNETNCKIHYYYVKYQPYLY